MVGCLSSIYTCWMRALWCIRLLCLRAGCSRLLMRPPKGPTTPRARPRVELVKVDGKEDKDDKTENVLHNIVHSAKHNTPATTTVAQGTFRWNEWILTETLANNRGIKVSVCTHRNHETRQCVIKSQAMTSNVQREVDCLRRCNHPNIVQYIDHRVRKGRMELAMAHCPGQELFDYIIECSPEVDLEVARQIACQLLTAVAYLHDTLGIVHRDIKPENIIYDKDTGSLQLIDFGYARPFTERTMLRSQVSTTKHTQLRSKVGTPYYIPPEILLGRPYTCTVDEWSTGVTLFMVLYGFPPFPGETEMEINPLILKGRPWSVKCTRSSEAYDCIHNQLLRKDPAKRATAAQVLESAWLRPCRDTAQAETHASATQAHDNVVK